MRWAASVHEQQCLIVVLAEIHRSVADGLALLPLRQVVQARCDSPVIRRIRAFGRL